MLADLAMQAQMSASADLAARLVSKSRRPVRASPRSASLRRLPCASPRRHAGSAVRGRAISAMPTMSCCFARREHRAKIALALAQAIEADVAPRTALPLTASRRHPNTLDAAPNEVRAPVRARPAAPRSRRLQPEGARPDRSVVAAKWSAGSPMPPPGCSRCSRRCGSISRPAALVADAARLSAAAADQCPRL